MSFNEIIISYTYDQNGPNHMVTMLIIEKHDFHSK